MDWKNLPPGDPALIDKIVQEYMSQGKFDELRRKMLAEVDTVSSYYNVKQRMENSVRSHLDRQRWRPDLPKNQLRDGLKRHVAGAPFLRPGVRRTISLLVNKGTMDNHRSDLEAIARDLLGISEQKIEPEVMDIQPDPMDSPDDNRMVIATDEDTMNGSENNDDEKLIGAMEDLSIPEMNEIKEESQSDEKLEEAVVEQELSDDDSDHSIIKQMSPLSVGTPSPPSSPVPNAESSFKRASEFVGKIPKVKKEEEIKVKEEEVKTKVKVEDEGKSKPKEEKRDRSREKKSSRDRDRRSYKSSRRDRDSDHRSRDRDRRRDSERRDRRDKNESKDKDRSKKDERHRSSDSKSRREEKPAKETKVLDKLPVEEIIPETIKTEPITDDGVIGDLAGDLGLLAKVDEEGKAESGVTEEDKTGQGLAISTMTTRSRFRGPVTETPSPSGSENVYSKKYLRPARRDIR